MNTTQNTVSVRPAPSWAASSEPDDPQDASVIRHRGPEISTDDRMSMHLELLESSSHRDYSICLYVSGNEDYPSAGFYIDVEDESIGDSSEFARRIAAQLLIAADAMDSARE